MTSRALCARRIVIWGCTGSGKSTAAAEIGRLTGLSVVDGDALCWRPGWEPVPRAEIVAAFEAVAARPDWVLDADGPDGMMFAEADLLVLLDYPRWLSFARLLRRSVHRAWTQTPVCNGNYESWARILSSDSQLLWHVRSWKRKHRRMGELAVENPGRVLWFTRPAQLQRWIEGLRAAGRAVGE